MTHQIANAQKDIDALVTNEKLSYQVNQAKAYAYLQEKRNPNLSEEQKAEMNRCDNFILKK